MNDTMSDLDDFGRLLLIVLAAAQDLSIEVRIAIPVGPRLTRGRIIPVLEPLHRSTLDQGNDKRVLSPAVFGGHHRLENILKHRSVVCRVNVGAITQFSLPGTDWEMIATFIPSEFLGIMQDPEKLEIIVE